MWLALTAMADLGLPADCEPEPRNTQPWMAMRLWSYLTVSTGPGRVNNRSASWVVWAAVWLQVLKEIRVWGTPQS